MCKFFVPFNRYSQRLGLSGDGRCYDIKRCSGIPDSICNLDNEHMRVKVKRGGIESEGEERRDRKWGRGKDSTGR